MQTSLQKIEYPVEFTFASIQAWNIHKTRLAKYLKKVAGIARFEEDYNFTVYDNPIFTRQVVTRGTDQYKLARLLGLTKKAIKKLKTDFFDKGGEKLEFNLNKGVRSKNIMGEDQQYVKNTLKDKLGNITDFYRDREQTITVDENSNEIVEKDIVLNEYTNIDLTDAELYVFIEYFKQMLQKNWTKTEINEEIIDNGDGTKTRKYTEDWTGDVDKNQYIEWANNTTLEIPCPAKGSGQRDKFGHEEKIIENDVMVEMFVYIPDREKSCVVTRFLKEGLHKVSFQEYTLMMGTFSQIVEYNDGSESILEFIWDAFKMVISLPQMLIEEVTKLLLNNPITYYIIKPALYAVGETFGINKETIDSILSGVATVTASLAVGYGIGTMLGLDSTLGTLLGNESLTTTEILSIGTDIAGTFAAGYMAYDGIKGLNESMSAQKTIKDKVEYPASIAEARRKNIYKMFHPIMLLEDEYIKRKRI